MENYQTCIGCAARGDTEICNDMAHWVSLYPCFMWCLENRKLNKSPKSESAHDFLTRRWTLPEPGPGAQPEESLVSHSRSAAGMRLHHKEKCLVPRLDTGSSLPSKLNKLCPCLEKLQKHRTALLINPVSQMCKRVCSIHGPNEDTVHHALYLWIHMFDIIYWAEISPHVHVK